MNYFSAFGSPIINFLFSSIDMFNSHYSAFLPKNSFRFSAIRLLHSLVLLILINFPLFVYRWDGLSFCKRMLKRDEYTIDLVAVKSVTSPIAIVNNKIFDKKSHPSYRS